MVVMTKLNDQLNIREDIPIIRISSFKRYVLLIVAILILANISIEFDIPIYRQLMGVLLLLLPGLLFIRLLDPIIEDTVEKLVLTFSICISILIFIGLSLSYISQSIGIYRPLSTESLLIMFDSFCLLFIIMLSGKKFSVIKLSFPKNQLTRYDKLFLSIAILIPVWSFWGTHMINRYSYNTLLLGLFIFVSIVILLVSIYHEKISSNIYPIIILSISISFVLLYPMRSDHLLGMDVHSEYYLFQEVINNLSWQLVPSDNFLLLGPCASISLLPAIFQLILQVNPETLYRLYIPILFSITPIIVYIIAKRYLNNNEAFLSSIAFISYYSYFTASFYSRATFALFFFASLIMTLFNDTLRQSRKRILLLLFSISMIFTHYSSTFVLIFIVGTLSIITAVLSKKINFKRELTITLALTIIASSFLWYSMITDGIFNISIEFIKSVLNMENRYVEGAYSEMVYQLKGDISRNYISELNLINTWLFLFLIGIGTFGLISRSKYYWLESKEKDRYVHLKKEFEPEFMILVVLCVVILVMTLILPFLSTAYDLSRIYFQLSVIISVVFIFGGKYAAILIYRIINVLKIANIDKNRNYHFKTEKLAHIITLIVLIPHLLFMANVPAELAGNGESFLFNSICPEHDRIYIHDSDISCIKWWNHNRIENHNLWADYFGAVQIKSQGHIEHCSKITENLEKIPETEYIYLRETNIEKNRIYYNFDKTETTEIFVFNEPQLDKLYSSPATILYKSSSHK